MIDAKVFRASRDAARKKLPPEVAANSFGYYIDIPNTWESYKSKEDLVGFLSIHRTHTQFENEIVEDLGAPTDFERDWSKRYIAVYENVARMITANGHRDDLRHDIAETAFDWRTIQQFTSMPCKVLDFGAGCARQGTSAMLHHPGNIYVAVDAVLAAYTVQNLTMQMLSRQFGSFYDFLDGRKLPKIADAKPGDLYHVPTWMIEANLPPRFFDVIIASHVHNELSKDDFLRLIYAVDQGLAKDGIFYVRSEMQAFHREYTVNSKTISLHGLDPVAVLRERGIVPVYAEKQSAFLTTVFARENSLHVALPYKTSRELCLAVADKYTARHMNAIVNSDNKVLIVGSMAPYFKKFVSPVKDAIKHKAVIPEVSLWLPGVAQWVRRYKPDVVVIASSRLCGPVEHKVKAIMDFPLVRRYWHPVIFLYSAGMLKRDKFWVTPKLRPE